MSVHERWRFFQRLLPHVVGLLTLLVVASPHAALPRAIGRAFLDAGVPLNAVAVVVQDVGSVRPLFAQQATRAMNPASVMKLVTTFAALDTLGAQYRWRTEAYLDGPLDNGVLKGNLVLKGYGDPKITVEQWQALIATLRSRGLQRIDGDLLLDRTYFAVPAHDPAAFDGAPLKPYNVGADALLVNFKSVHFIFAPDTTGTAVLVGVDPPLPSVHIASMPTLGTGRCDDWRSSVTATFDDRHSDADVAFAGSYPASCGERSWWVALLGAPDYVHAMFTTYFRAAGGTFGGGWRSGVAPDGTRPFAVLESPPLYDIVRDVNKLSNNVMAQQMFLTLAITAGPPPATPAGAAAAIQRWLRERKLAMPELVIDNGSGLSRTGRISAGSLARLLVAAHRSAVGDEFATSLAVAGTDGTVERRFQSGSVLGQALLKTGSLEGVRALAGYVLDAGGRRFVVVALINHPQAARGQPALDFLVQWVYRNGASWSEAAPH